MSIVIKIGPRFPDELADAGLLGKPFSWQPNGSLIFGDGMTEADRAAVLALIELHDPDALGAAPVPQVVSRFQGREAMWRTPYGGKTLFEAAEDILGSPETPATYKRAWDDLQEFRRDSEMLAAIAGMLGLTAVQIDALFILAGSVKA